MTSDWDCSGSNRCWNSVGEKQSEQSLHLTSLTKPRLQDNVHVNVLCMQTCRIKPSTALYAHCTLRFIMLFPRQSLYCNTRPSSGMLTSRQMHMDYTLLVYHMFSPFLFISMQFISNYHLTFRFVHVCSCFMNKTAVEFCDVKIFLRYYIEFPINRQTDNRR